MMSEVDFEAPSVVVVASEPKKKRKNDDQLEVRTAEDLPEFCVVGEVAQFFRVEKPLVLAWLRNKSGDNYFPHARKVQGNRWRIPKSDVLALAERLFG